MEVCQEVDRTVFLVLQPVPVVGLDPLGRDVLLLCESRDVWIVIPQRLAGCPHPDFELVAVAQLQITYQRSQYDNVARRPLVRDENAARSATLAAAPRSIWSLERRVLDPLVQLHVSFRRRIRVLVQSGYCSSVWRRYHRGR